MAEKKPTPPKSRSRSKSVKSNSIITPIILFAVALFLEALALISQKDVAVWNFLHNFIQSFFGLCAVVWPIDTIKAANKAHPLLSVATKM